MMMTEVRSEMKECFFLSGGTNKEDKTTMTGIVHLFAQSAFDAIIPIEVVVSVIVRSSICMSSMTVRFGSIVFPIEVDCVAATMSFSG